MTYLGDFAEDATVRRFFNTVDSAGSPVTIGGTAAAEVYKDSGTTQITAGVTITEDFDGVTGLHLLAIDMSADAGYTTGSDYAAVISVGTADSVSIVGGVLVQWSCENRRVNAIKDGTITANTFDTGVLATDADIADAVWDEARADHTDADTFGEGVNVYSLVANAQGNVRTSVGLAAANLDTQLSTIDTVVDAIVVDTGTDLPASLSAIVADTNELQTDWANGGRLDLLLDQAATAASVPSAATIADAVLDEALSGHATAGTVGAALTDILADTAELQGDWANGGRLDLILDGVAAGGSAPTVEQIVDGILDEPVASHATAGSVGAAIGSASTTETRDLEPVQHVWRFSRRSGGDIVASNVLNIAPGETIRAGFECAASIVLPAGSVLATMTAATPSSGDVIATKLGIDATQAKVSVVAADDATTGETHHVRCEVTNSLGGGPLVLLGPVTVRAEPS